MSDERSKVQPDEMIKLIEERMERLRRRKNEINKIVEESDCKDIWIGYDFQYDDMDVKFQYRVEQ